MHRSRPRSRARHGQALVEFGLSLPILMALLMGSIEMSRLLNVYVTANRLARRAALEMAGPDVTSSRSPLAGLESLRLQLRDPRDLDQWNQAYGPLILALQTAAPEASYVELDVNLEQDGSLHSRATIVLSLPPLLIPTAQLGSREVGRMPVQGRGIAVNEMQSLRRDMKGAYPAMRVSIDQVLAHPEDPLPPLPTARK